MVDKYISLIFSVLSPYLTHQTRLELNHVIIFFDVIEGMNLSGVITINNPNFNIEVTFTSLKAIEQALIEVKNKLENL